MTRDRAEKKRPLLGIRRPSATRIWGWVILPLLIALLLGLTACSSEEPDITVAALGAAVGNAKMDDVEFPALLETFTTESYRAGTQPDQANYQVYLTAKAAELGLNNPGPGDVQVERQMSGKKASFTFSFGAGDALFAVADVGRIDVALVLTDSQPYPWRIESIVLTR